jgi:Arc/MetJ-type ribon-helix-helix transcriptional regulator
MNVLLPADLEQYVESLVRTGKYPASSDVIAEALRQHKVARPAVQIVMTPELERALDEAMEEKTEPLTTDQLRERR